MAENIIDLNEGTFESEVKNASGVVLVDFWASWCGPCKMIGPLLEEIAEGWADKLKVCKVNVDDNQKLASDYGVMSIPQLICLPSNAGPAAVEDTNILSLFPNMISPFVPISTASLIVLDL